MTAEAGRYGRRIVTADWALLRRAVERARLTTIEFDLGATRDRDGAVLREMFDADGVDLADPDQLFVVLAAWRVLSVMQERVVEADAVGVAASCFAALAELVPDGVLT